MLRDQVQEMFQFRGKELAASRVFHGECHQAIQYTQISQYLTVAGFDTNDRYDNLSGHTVLLFGASEGRCMVFHELNPTADGGRVNKQ